MIASLPPAGVLTALLEALESAGLGCTIIIKRGDTLERAYANNSLARIYGVDVETVRAMPPMALFPDRDQHRVVASFAPPDPVQQLEIMAVRPDGREVPIELSLGDVTLDGSRAMFVFVRDMSKNRAMQAALRESEERFRRVAEACPDSIAVYAKGKYVYANPAALRYLGAKSLEELSTMRPGIELTPQQRAMFNEKSQRARAGERVPPFQHVHIEQDGRERILEISLSCVSIDGEDAIVSYSRDISERVRLQAELMKQDRLASVGMLAAGVAHELNNPLTALRLQARKLSADADKYDLPAEVRETVQQMDEAATRMSEIISDLLFMARPVELPQMHVDIAQILSSTLALLRAGMPECPPIHTDLAPLPPVQGHASKLGQVFMNLLRNAAQAVTHVQGGAIHVCARAARDGVEIDVADNGSGIPSDVLPRVTQPFFTTKRHGTGLGLWISQSLVAHHGGTLHLSSVENQGTKVTVWLPEKLPPE